MRTRRTLWAVAATVGLAISGIGLSSVAGVASAAGAGLSGISCAAGVIPAGTYAYLNVPPGSACLTEGVVVVNRGVTLGRGAGIGVDQYSSLTVNGPLTVGPDAALAPFTPENPGSITVNGPLAVQAGGWFATDGPTIAGPVWAINASALQIFYTNIAGSVVIDGGGGENTVLNSEGQCYGNSCPGPPYAYNLNWLGWNDIAGPVSVTNYGGNWTGIIGNVMGPMIFANNSTFAGSAIGFNTINGVAFCSNNAPAPNTSSDVSGPSLVRGPTWGNQRKTCTGVAGGTWPYS